MPVSPATETAPTHLPPPPSQLPQLLLLSQVRLLRWHQPPLLLLPLPTTETAVIMTVTALMAAMTLLRPPALFHQSLAQQPLLRLQLLPQPLLLTMTTLGTSPKISVSIRLASPVTFPFQLATLADTIRNVRKAPLSAVLSSLLLPPLNPLVLKCRALRRVVSLQ